MKKLSFMLLAVTVIAGTMSCTKQVQEVTTSTQTQPVLTDASTSAKLASSDLLWSGAASNGIEVFKGYDLQDNDLTYATTNPSPNGSYIQTATDGAEGTVWHFHKDALDRRAEARGATGITITVGSTYYIGFKFKLAQVPAYNQAGGYHAVMQWKTYGTPNNQNYPLLFVYNNGNVVFQHFMDGGTSVNLYSHAVSASTWYSVVIKVVVGNTATTGSTQFYWGNDSSPETLLTGGTSYTCKTFDGTSINPKWGYYHQTDANGDDYFSRLKIGTTYASVQPY
jgi:hypothetical protein